MPSKTGSMSNPVWDQAFKLLIPDLFTQVITIKVMTLLRGQLFVVGENTILGTGLSNEMIAGRR